ncbi:MAG: LysM peptidoglycan-binding domain-containing protein [Minwuia sp.]|uniref:LysM peptidoglycan-binding domain-containing protein n=1 Tax=Minwuia sp. TaxID=2493630 RepID=UPI003A89489D
MNRTVGAVLVVLVVAVVAAFLLSRGGDEPESTADNGSVKVTTQEPAAPAQPASEDAATAPESGGAAQSDKTAVNEDKDGVAGAVDKAGDAVAKAVENVGDRVREAGQALSRAAGSASEEVGKAGEEVAKAVGADDVAEQAGNERDEKREPDPATRETSGESKGEPEAVTPSRKSATEDEPKVAALPALTPPSFDIVRISNRDCTAVLAGRADPGATVTLLANGQPLATVVAESSGEWAHLIHDPLTPGSISLSLVAELDGRQAAASDDVVLIVPDCREGGDSDTAIAVLTPKSGGGTRLLQSPEPEQPGAKPKGLNVGKVDYDDKGNISVSGSSDPEREVRAYVDDKLIGRAAVDSEGQWKLVPETEISPGLHVLRVDQVDSAGEVLARIELPFARARPGTLDLSEDQIIVQPGNSLWRIARRTYGAGVQYSVIYQANSDRIRDPDLIYPGQVFRLPAISGGASN